MSSNVLTPRDSNAPMKSASPQKKGVKSLEVHRQELKNKLQKDDPSPNYVSPSDSIQSPATQKLAAMRTKHALKKGKPKTLFETASSKKIASAKGTLSFADIPNNKPVGVPMNNASTAPAQVSEQDIIFARDLNKSPVFEATPSVQEAQQQAAQNAGPEDASDPERGARQDDEMEDA